MVAAVRGAFCGIILVNAQKLVCGCTLERLASMTAQEIASTTGVPLDKAAMMLAAARMARG